MRRLKKAVNRFALPWSLVVLLAAAAGCSGPIIMEGNYLTYEHEFTDAAAEKVKKNAEELCGQRKQKALKVNSVCNLKTCFTHYQCVDRKDPLEYIPPSQ